MLSNTIPVIYIYISLNRWTWNINPPREPLTSSYSNIIGKKKRYIFGQRIKKLKELKLI